jgi:hypothetical protein
MSPHKTTIYNLHGLRVRSEIPLPAPTLPTRKVDLDVRWSHRIADPDRPVAGRVIATFASGDGAGYALSRTEAGWTLRFHTVGEFRFDGALRRVRVRSLPGGEKALIPLLIAGNVTAFVLSLTGSSILHASAVEFCGGGVGFLGRSGMGKSTLAALCCASGARLIADDILRLEPTLDGFRCIRGPSEIRLRESSAGLANRLTGATRRFTADRRLAIRADCASHDRIPLKLLAVSQPSRDCKQISIEPLNRVEALFELTRYARIVGWRAPEQIAQQFARSGAIAATIPVCKAVIPWGPPFMPELGRALLDALSPLARAERVA